MYRPAQSDNIFLKVGTPRGLSRINPCYLFLITLNTTFSATTGLVTPASSRHLDNGDGGINLDELAGRGNFIPRPQTYEKR